MGSSPTIDYPFLKMYGMEMHKDKDGEKTFFCEKIKGKNKSPFSVLQFHPLNYEENLSHYASSSIRKESIEYFEVEILQLPIHERKGFVVGVDTVACISIGLSNIDIVENKYFLGWKDGSVGIHSDNGGVYESFENIPENLMCYNILESFGLGDVVGMGWDNKGNTYFTKNGKRFDFRIARRKDLEKSSKKLYPTVSVYVVRKNLSVMFKINRGEDTKLNPFRFFKFNFKRSVICMGIYNSGKSTLLNKLIGKDLCPTDDVTLTNVIWKTKKGLKRTYSLYRQESNLEETYELNDDYEEILEDLANRIRNDETFSVIYKPKVVIRESDSDILGNFTFIDTGGLGEENEISNMSYMGAEKADIVVICINGQTNWKILVEEERKVLRTTRRRLQMYNVNFLKKIMVVITHADVAMESRIRIGGRKFSIDLHRKRNNETFEVILKGLREADIFGKSFKKENLFLLSSKKDVIKEFEYYRELWEIFSTAFLNWQ